MVSESRLFFLYHFEAYSGIHAEHIRWPSGEPVHTPDMRLPALADASNSFHDAVSSERLRGVNVGLLASSAIGSVPVGKRADITVSGRLSYINALYGMRVKANSTIMTTINDYNLTARFIAGGRVPTGWRRTCSTTRDFLSTADTCCFPRRQCFRWHNFWLPQSGRA